MIIKKRLICRLKNCTAFANTSINVSEMIKTDSLPRPTFAPKMAGRVSWSSRLRPTIISRANYTLISAQFLIQPLNSLPPPSPCPFPPLRAHTRPSTPVGGIDWVLRKQDGDSPLYALSAVICLDAACTCSRSFTLSMGATAVLEIAAAMPPAIKSLAKLMGSKPLDMMVECV